ncbi:MAG: hypothetical protein NZ959_01200 [Armatimonadetes bacterium]|nr:hypothetical protein [Armatimonadota bacterium]MDW8121870.1 hypothetical protein [Armatimonadota bacterium]
MQVQDAFGGSDVANAIAVDLAGNSYTGGSATVGSQEDFWLIKRGPDGTLLGSVTYNGPGNGPDRIVSIAIGNGGTSIYVTGPSQGTTSHRDWAIIKYDPSLGQVWLRRFDGPGNQDDDPVKVLVDPSDNVIVVGTVWHSTQYQNIAVRKYDAAGTVLWTRQINGPVNGNDFARDAFVDAAGNVYVCGASTGLGYNTDMIVAKYNSAGTLLWSRRYNGPGNGDDEATSLCVDPSGNVAITGFTFGGATDDDFTTIKYSPAGTRLWVRRWGGPSSFKDRAIRIGNDAAGNLFVTGSRDLNWATDVVTIKYTPSGATAWRATYDGPVSSTDEARDLKVTPNGIAVIAARSFDWPSWYDFTVLVYGPDGRRLSAQRFNGSGWYQDEARAVAIVFGNSVAIYAAGSAFTGTYEDFATAKYEGPVAVTYDGGGDDEGVAITKDGSGNVYATGWRLGTTGKDIVTQKIGPDGSVAWTAFYNNATHNGDDMPSDIAVDGAGNVYVIGTTYNGATAKNDIVVLKYNVSGVLQWTRIVNTANGDDFGVAIALHSNGTPFVVGHGYRSTTNLGDIRIMRLSPTTGGISWTRYHNGPASGDDFATDILVTPGAFATASVYVLGAEWAGDPLTGGSDYDYVLIRFDTAGNLQPNWPQSFNGTGNWQDWPEQMVLSNGNVVLTGTVWNLWSGFDFGTLQFDPDGNLLWYAFYDGQRADDYASGVVVAPDPAGNKIVVVGSAWFQATQTDIVAVRYSSWGSQELVRRYNGPFSGDDFASGITTDGTNIFISGYSEDIWVDYDYVFLRYDPLPPLLGTGLRLVWENRYTSHAIGGDDRTAPKAIVINSRVWVTGTVSETTRNIRTVGFWK